MAVQVCGLWFEWKILITNSVSPIVQQLNPRTTSKRLVSYPISISGSNFLFLSNLSTTAIISWIWFVYFRTTSLGWLFQTSTFFSSSMSPWTDFFVRFSEITLTITFYFEKNMLVNMFISQHLWDFFPLCISITYFMPHMLWINMYGIIVWLTQGSHPWTIALYRLFVPCDKRRCEGSLNSTLIRHLTYLW